MVSNTVLAKVCLFLAVVGTVVSNDMYDQIGTCLQKEYETTERRLPLLTCLHHVSRHPPILSESTVEDVEDYVYAVCSSTGLLPCILGEVGSAFKKCTSDKKFLTDFETFSKMATVGFGYVCDNDAQNAKGFFKNGGINCGMLVLQNAGMIIDECNLNQTMTDLTKKMEMSHDLDEETCDVLGDSAKCVADNAACPNHKPVEIIHELFVKLLNEDPACASLAAPPLLSTAVLTLTVASSVVLTMLRF